MADEDRYWHQSLDDIERYYDPDSADKTIDRLWAQRFAEASAAVGENDEVTRDEYGPEHEDPMPTVSIPVDLEVNVMLPLGGMEVAMLIEAWTHFEDHNCEWGEDALLELGGLVVDQIKRHLIGEGILDETWSPDDE
jgi:hypothetical protein